MDPRTEHRVKRRALLQMLGASGGIYGLTSASVAGSDPRDSPWPTDDHASNFETVNSEKFMSTLLDVLEDHVFDPVWEKIQELDPSEVITVVREVVSEMATDALDTIEPVIEKAEFLRDHGDDFESVIDTKLSKLGDDEEGDEESGSISPPTESATAVGAGGAASRTVARSAIPDAGDIREGIDKLRGELDELGDVLEDLSDDATEEFDEHWENVDEFASDISGGIWGFIESAVDGIAAQIAKIADPLEDMLSDATDSTGSIPSFDLGLDLFPDVDLEVSVQSPIDSYDPDAELDPDAFDTGAGQFAGATASRPGPGPRFGAGSAAFASGGSLQSDIRNCMSDWGDSLTDLQNYGLSAGPQPLEFKNCPTAAGGNVVAFPFELEFRNPITDSGFRYEWFVGLDSRGCVYSASNADGTISFDITDYYEWMLEGQCLGKAIGEAIIETVDERIEGLEDAATCEEINRELDELEEFLDELETFGDGHVDDEYLLASIYHIHQDEFDAVIEELRSISCEDGIDRLEETELAEMLAEIAAAADELDVEMPNREAIAEAAGEIADTPSVEVELEYPRTIVESSDEVINWIDGLSDAERKQIEALTGRDLGTVQQVLATVADGELSVVLDIETLVGYLVNELLGTLKDRAIEMTEVSLDVSNYVLEFDCVGKCPPISKIKATVAAIFSYLVTKTTGLWEWIKDQFRRIREIQLPSIDLPELDIDIGDLIGDAITAVVILAIALGGLALILEPSSKVALSVVLIGIVVISVVESLGDQIRIQEPRRMV